MADQSGRSSNRGSGGRQPYARVRDQGLSARVAEVQPKSAKVGKPVSTHGTAHADRRQSSTTPRSADARVEASQLEVQTAATCSRSHQHAAQTRSLRRIGERSSSGVVAEKTGYPIDMLDLDLDLEADLGVDTVKQAEVMATIREAYGIARDDQIKLRDYPTLAHVIWLCERASAEYYPRGAAESRWQLIPTEEHQDSPRR